MTIPSWLAKYRITADWAKHRARGSAGGVDWATPAGTPLYAPADGTVYTRTLADQASVVGIRYSNGGATEYVHARFPASGTLKKGALLAMSDGRPGYPGAGVGPTASTGAHVHVHDMKNGLRVEPFTTVPSTTTAGEVESMNLDDTVRELDVNDYTKVAREKVTLRDRFEWIAWFTKRVQMILDGQLKSPVFVRIEKALADLTAAVAKLEKPKATVDKASIVEAVTDPAVLAAIAKAVNDDAARHAARRLQG